MEPTPEKRENANFAPWSKAEDEKREKMSQKKIAFALIKPGFEQYEEEILRILEENHLQVIFSDKVRLTPDFVEHLYGKLAGERFFPAIKDYLTSNDVILLMVGGSGEDAQSILNSLKKDKRGNDGLIRQKFKLDPTLSSNEIELWKSGLHPQQDDVTIMLTQRNVLHTADSPEEAISSLQQLLGDKFNSMRIRGTLPSELWDFFNDRGEENETRDIPTKS